ncbi:glycoside hydrolase family 140 protein [soil metagenome]
MPTNINQALPRLRVSDNQRFLVTITGEPFFWLGDTAWEIFHRLTREEAEFYFATRQRQRFNVIQAVALAEFDGLHTPNAYGELPLLNDDPAQPNEKYFAYMDELIQLAAAHELYVGLLPTWGDKINHNQWGTGPIVFNEQNARIYGQYLGQRYGDYPNIIWILGGDRPAIHEQMDYRPIWRAMAAGIEAATNHNALMTYHPMGGMSTSAWLQEEAWLDFNMMQSGHGSGRDVPVWEMIAHDYALQPVKPTLDSEPNYEDHPVNPWPQWNPKNGYFRDYDVRKQLYRSVFAGGCGVTYGHHAMWQFYDPAKREAVNYADRPWFEAINRHGANQVQFLCNLLASRPYLTRIPDQSLLVTAAGSAESHVRATRDANGTYALIYLPTAEAVSINLDLLSGAIKQAWWYNPRTGEALTIGEVVPLRIASFTPPIDGPDWVLVLDDAAQKFGAPGDPV